MDGSVDLAEYQLIFAEEFADFIPYEPSTKSGVWTTRYYWGPETVINKELQYYIDITSDQRKAVNPFRVEKGSLVIEGKPANPEDVHGFNNQRYTSGAITTKDSFSTTYGYFEIRAQVPAGKGLWPAFWLMPADKSPTPELDIMEMTGDRPNELVTNLHYRADGRRKSWQTFIAVPDMSKAYHTYAANWTPDTVTWYFDGRPVAHVGTPLEMHKPMYLLVNLAVGGSWPGAPDATTKFPAQYRIDHVRAYRRKTAFDRPELGRSERIEEKTAQTKPAN
jgi:beta-glucanase (GH16 family)